MALLACFSGRLVEEIRLVGKHPSDVVFADGFRYEDDSILRPRLHMTFDTAHLLVRGDLPSRKVLPGAVEIAVILRLAGCIHRYSEKDQDSQKTSDNHYPPFALLDPSNHLIFRTIASRHASLP